MNAGTLRHANFVGEMRSRYEREGFTVRAPRSGQELEAALRTLGVELIASSDDRRVAVLIAKPTSISEARRNLDSINKLLDGRPGWRLDVVLENVANDVTPAGDPWSADTIRHKLAFADRLSHDGKWDEALILGWAVFEAVIRAAAARLQIHIPSDVTGQALLKQAVYAGFIAEGDEAVCTRILAERNRAAHGLAVSTRWRRAGASQAKDFHSFQSMIERILDDHLGPASRSSGRRRAAS
jgi:hypothetical protein